MIDAVLDELITAERRLWTEGVEAYRELMAPDCLMIFPGMGVLDAERVIETLADAPRWAVDISQPRLLRREGTTLLIYRADARRREGAAYRAACLSAWHQDGGHWRILAHQQSPL